MDEKRNLILTTAEEQFIRFGFRKTNVDDIASSLGMSKKTIYKFFPSKRELLNEIIKTVEKEISSQAKEIMKSDRNAAEKLYDFGQLVGNRLRKISAHWLNDLMVNFPDLWNEIERFRRNTIQKNMSKILEQGKKEGLIIDKPNVVILTVLLSAIEGVVNPEFIINNNLSVQNAIDQTLEIVISGILTNKGKKVFKQAKKVKK